jgi:hypothetical protein
MNVLLAPNGKPSNLTPEQYKLVRLPEFKAWFGDWENDPTNASKVVDENGEPLICYHGAEVSYNERFYLFNKGSYFTDNFNSARYYSLKLAYGIEDVKEENTTIYECFLSIKKPKTFDYKNEDAEILFHDFDENDKRIKEYESNGYNGLIWEYDYVMYDFRSSMSETDWNNFIKTWENNPLKQKQDIDDFWKITETKKEKHFIIFNPNQIKLADGSNTTFDGNNPDIRFDDGGEARPFTDDGNKFVVFNQYRNYTPYKIAVDDVNNAEYITLWKTDTDTGKDKKMGYLRLYNSGDDFLSVSEISIDRGSKGLGLGLEMYKVALKYSSDKIKGIKSYLPNRTNKKQIPKIYKKLNSVKDGDYEFIYKENNPDIRFDDGGETNKNNMIIKFTPKIIDYLSDQVQIQIDTYDDDYDDDGILDEGIEEEYPFTLAKNRNDLENLQSKLQNSKGSSYSKIEKDFLIARIEMTLDAMYDDSEMVSERRALINAQKKLQENNSAYEEGGEIKWNVDRYRQVEKEMFELRKQGKGDTLEYFKLIKERTMLEQAKMNQNNNTENNFAKGGKVIVQPAEIQKFKKIGVEDKYFIEASKDVGLQGINFDYQSILKRIDSQFNDMLDNYESYLINEDSASITNYINNEIETLKEQGSSMETIQRWEQMKENPSSRIGLINDIAKTQKESLDKWVDYLRLSEYKLPFKFLMLKAVLNFNYDLKQSKLFERGNDTIRNFTPFDAGSLAELNDKNSDYLLLDYSVLMNENSIKILNSQEIVQQSGNGKWIKFNGGKKTPPATIQQNGTRLMNLVQNTYWCTKSAGTNQLRGGDFYVYVTESNGEIFPRIAVRMNENNVGEVRGNKSSAQDLDAEMLPIAEEFLIKNIPNSSGKKWLDSITFNKRCVQMTKRFEAEGMYKDFIFDYMKLISHKNNYQVDYGANSNVVLLEKKFAEIIQVPNEYYGKNDIASNFNQLSRDTIYYIGDIGRYELNIFNLENLPKLKYISGNFNPSSFPITDFGNIEYVGGNVTLSKLNTNIGKIKYIGGSINLQDSDIDSFSNLESVGGMLYLKGNIKDLGKLKKIGGLEIISCNINFTLGSLEEIENDLQVSYSSVDIDFGNLKTIGGSLIAKNTIITDLKNLESVGGDFIIAGSKIKKFENLKNIGGNADFSNNFCSSTQNIETILGDIKFLNSRIMEFPKLNKIGGTIEFRGSYFKSFGNIRYIGGSLNFAESKLEELGELDYVGGYVSFKGSKIKSLNKLKKVVGFANFDSSQVEDLGDLESVGGNLYLLNSIIKSLGKLNYVGGTIMMNKNKSFVGLEGNYDEVAEQLNK